MSDSGDEVDDPVAVLLPVHQFLIEVLLANMLREYGPREIEAFVESVRSVYSESEVPPGDDEHHAVRIADVMMQSEAMLSQIVDRALDRLREEARDEEDDFEDDPLAAARAWVGVGFEGARENGLDMSAVAEEAMIRAMAVLADRDPESVRAEAPALIEATIDALQTRLAAKPGARRRPKPSAPRKPG